MWSTTAGVAAVARGLEARLDVSREVVGQGRFGVKIASLVTYLRTVMRLPVRQIQAYLTSLHGLSISSGEIISLACRMKAQLEPQLAEVKQQIRVSPAVQMVERFLPELVVFVAVPGVPVEYNLAERSVRPLVIARKISGGTRSPEGSETRMGLFSLFGTWSAEATQSVPAMPRRPLQKIVFPTHLNNIMYCP